MEKIKFQLEDGTEAEFYVEEQTRIGGVAYLLVSDSLDDEATAYIFKDVSEDDSQEACYEMVEDEDEMQAVFKVFEQMLDDVDLEMLQRAVEGNFMRKEHVAIWKVASTAEEAINLLYTTPVWNKEIRKFAAI